MRKSLGLALLLVTGTGGPVFAQETGAGGGGPLTVDGGLVIWTLVVFGLLLYVLKRNAWPVLLAAVREREQKLERQLAEAEKNRAEAAAGSRPAGNSLRSVDSAAPPERRSPVGEIRCQEAIRSAGVSSRSRSSASDRCSAIGCKRAARSHRSRADSNHLQKPQSAS